MGNNMGISQITKSVITTWPRYPTSVYISIGNQISIPETYMHPHDSCNTTNSSQIWDQPRCLLVDEWIKMCDIYTVRYYSGIERMKFC